MNTDTLIKVLKFIARASGVPKSTFFSRWSVFAYPFWQQGNQIGFKVMYYKGVDSNRTRATKMLLNHALTCLTSGLGAGTTGLGELGSNLTNVNKFGGLKSAFDVDIGAVQLATVKGSKKSSPRDIANAILASGKLLKYAIVRVDVSRTGRSTLYFRADNRPNGYTEWGVRNIASLEKSSVRYLIYPNGLTMRDAQAVGNWKTGKKA